VDVADGDVGTVAALYRGGELGLEVPPSQHVHADLDVLVLAVELVDHLAHERAVAAGEAVPEGQADVGAGVLGPAAEQVAGCPRPPPAPPAPQGRGGAGAPPPWVGGWGSPLPPPPPPPRPPGVGGPYGR